jgi:CRISPR-associated endonuclease/helicase Cas3
VTLAGTGKPVAESAGLSDLNTGRELQLLHIDDKDVVDWVLAQVADGGCVAVIHNLVRRAVATYEALKERIAAMPSATQPRLIMVNGQMPAGERREVEAELRAAFGKDGVRPSRAIVVSTQVLEQGLDLDFDAMLTSAPADSIASAGRRPEANQRWQSLESMTPMMVPGSPATSAWCTPRSS